MSDEQSEDKDQEFDDMLEEEGEGEEDYELN